MPTQGLIRSIAEAHLAGSAPRESEWAVGASLALRPDQVLAGGSAAVVALMAFESLGWDRVRTDVAMVGAERVALQEGFENADHLMALQRIAHRLGIHFARPGDGRCERIHLERLAAPARLALFAGRRPALAGAIGMLALPARSIEAAAALAGHPHEMAWPGVLACELVGSHDPLVDGHDLALAMAAQPDPRAAAGRLIEFCGESLSALPMGARIALAARSASFGSPACVFPSDERTRAWLAARGREADWKSLAGQPIAGKGDRRIFELSAIEPQLGPFDRPGGSRPVRESRGGEVASVLVGPGVTGPELACLAAALEGRKIHPGVRLIIVPGTRSLAESAARQGIWALIEAAGAEVREGGAPPVAGAVGLACGADAVDLPAGRTRWFNAGLPTCVAVALTGRIEDPRRVEMRWIAEPASAAESFDEGWKSGPVQPTEDGVTEVARRSFPLGRPFEGALRGEVLIRLGDHVSIQDLLPWGPRVRPLVGDLPALAEHTLGEKDPGFAARARARSGGMVVAGEQLGCGLVWDTAALAPLALGVRAVLARSIAPDYAQSLALAGVLPLEFSRSRDAASIDTGDEIEIPGLPEALVCGRPLTVRNLTRATSCTVRHMLGEREVFHLRAGGLLAGLRSVA